MNELFQSVIKDTGLAAITLLVGEYNSKEKDSIISIIEIVLMDILVVLCYIVLIFICFLTIYHVVVYK